MVMVGNPLKINAALRPSVSDGCRRVEVNTKTEGGMAHLRIDLHLATMGAGDFIDDIQTQTKSEAVLVAALTAAHEGLEQATLYIGCNRYALIAYPQFEMLFITAHQQAHFAISGTMGECIGQQIR